VVKVKHITSFVACYQFSTIKKPEKNQFLITSFIGY
jgi:hypothetical protein